MQGVHTCGTVSAASNTASCQNLISISNANNSGVMGYGKLNARGGDVVLNSFPTAGYEGTTAGKSWWDLASDANTLGASQQNPRGIQISNSTNITLYKITFKNPPNFHVALNTVNGFTAWDIKIVTPFSARNTDGIDPGNATNVTIKNSWISDGDDNVAVGAPSSLSSNISVVNNHFYAGHGESIGSFTNWWRQQRALRQQSDVRRRRSRRQQLNRHPHQVRKRPRWQLCRTFSTPTPALRITAHRFSSTLSTTQTPARSHRTSKTYSFRTSASPIREPWQRALSCSPALTITVRSTL